MKQGKLVKFSNIKKLEQKKEMRSLVKDSYEREIYRLPERLRKLIESD